ncbi:nitroreductase/quinone reductase family protein [Nakamurella sp. PAMC28650]|jgi:deazaflavin-dependent oxidoreductase (nitroreductase family)|uniref:nitroreductase/quinone reductase family protein n=1 Tax=Nakamurella sp. PAMC28650 TaxID=2762325 RepID=UPI00164CF3A6|nr:nitroreductase/quinone reductase family protein [Nakamurella sp. PAMC28650]QNK82383.1 nitroreductase family deazaflavin-dependent oxidoreductase [Nakamurella sp. PAMC28650]
MTDTRYIEPGIWTRVFNSMVALATRLGVTVWGSRQLYVRGRSSGELRQTPVNLLTFEGRRYLVAPRGITQWVRNIRVAGEGELRLGRRIEKFIPVELADEQKPAILRAYLKRWKFEIGAFFQGVGPDASDEQLLAIASGYPVFLVTTA